MSGIEWQHIFDLQLAIESFPYILQGIGYTILISFGGMAVRADTRLLPGIR